MSAVGPLRWAFVWVMTLLDTGGRKFSVLRAANIWPFRTQGLAADEHTHTGTDRQTDRQHDRRFPLFTRISVIKSWRIKLYINRLHID